ATTVWAAKRSEGLQRSATMASSLVLSAEGVARNVCVPVHERAAGVFLPRPYMQRVERRQPEAIGTLEQVKELSHQLRRPGMLGVPGVGENEIVGADQSEPSVRQWLVDHNLGTRGVQLAVHDEGQVHEVHPHSPCVG